MTRGSRACSRSSNRAGQQTIHHERLSVQVSRERVETYLYKADLRAADRRGAGEGRGHVCPRGRGHRRFIATVYRYAFVGLMMLDWIRKRYEGAAGVIVDRLAQVMHRNVTAALEAAHRQESIKQPGMIKFQTNVNACDKFLITGVSTHCAFCRRVYSDHQKAIKQQRNLVSEV